MLKRMMVLLLIALTLGACGVGGGGAASTATPPPTATARPEPTARPSATPQPQPTAEPTKSGSTGAVGSIPAPPDSTPYVKGEDPIVDTAITAMETEFANQTGTGLNLQNLTFYVSTASVADTVAFYDQEMPNNGWGAGQTQDQDFGKVMAFIGTDNQSIGLIGLLDLKTTGAADGLIIFTTIGKPEGGSGGTLPPSGNDGTATPAGSASGSDTTPTDIVDVPAPPQSEPYTAGSDNLTDSFLEGFSRGFKQSFDGQAGLKLVGQQQFVTSAGQQDIKAFYDDEMVKLGWTGAAPTDNPQAQILNYTRVNGQKVEVAVVASIERSKFSTSNTDTLVVIVVAATE